MNERKMGIILSYVYTIIHTIVNLIYVPILLNTIGQSEYGLYQMIGSLMAYISIMEPLLSNAVLRYYCKYNSLGDEEKKENVLAISQRLYAIMSVVAVIVSIIMMFIFKDFYRSSLTPNEIKESMLMIMILTCNVVVNLLSYVYYASITANERYIFLRLLYIFASVLQPVTIILIIKRAPYAMTVTCIQFAVNIIVAIIKFIYSKYRLKIKIKYHYRDMKFVKDLFSLSFGIFFALVADQIFWKADQLILGKMANTSVVAIYAVGAQIFMNYSPVGTAISGVFMPRLSQLYDKEHNMNAISELFIKVGRLSFMGLAMILCGFGLYGKSFIRLWAGNNFDDAYYIAIIIMIPLTVDVMQNLGLYIMQITNQYAFRGKMSLAIAITNIITTIILFKYFGLIGAAAATAFSFTLGNGIIMNFYYDKKVGLDIKGFWKEIVKILPGVIISFVLGCFIKMISINNLLLELVVHLTLFVVCYFAVNYILSMNKYEKNLVQSFVKKTLKLK